MFSATDSGCVWLWLYSLVRVRLCVDYEMLLYPCRLFGAWLRGILLRVGVLVQLWFLLAFAGAEWVSFLFHRRPLRPSPVLSIFVVAGVGCVARIIAPLSYFYVISFSPLIRPCPFSHC